MRTLAGRLAAATACLALPLAAGAACPPSCAIPGGGPPALDCHAEFASEGIRLNYPAFDPAKPKPGKEVRCLDGDAGCDRDGVVNNGCVFDVNVCLRNADPALPACSPSDVTTVAVGGVSKDPDLAALQTALDALLPAASSVCTAGRTLAVPLKGPDSKSRFKAAKKKVQLKAGTAAGTDSDRLKLTCLPRGWPSHGYEPRNTRATPLETILSPAHASQLVQRWDLDLAAALGTPSNAVTSTPVVGEGLVYIGAWSGHVMAAKEKNGKLKWSYDTLSAGIGAASGVTGSVTLTADGRALVGDAAAVVHCLNAKKGSLLWKTPIGDPAVDQVWASPTVVGNRVYVGVASHNDVPCTRGRLVALDLDTGAVLWTRPTVPDRVCDTDTAIACSADADCGGGNCVQARGAGVTATVAADPGGAFVYMNTVGCYTFPSVGDSDSIFKLDAATGEVVWKVRVTPSEQFGACAGDGAVDCRGSADCAFVGGPCTLKSAYHDFGFLNGPLLVEADDGMAGRRELVVSGSKDGSLYARDPATGAAVWTRAVVPLPVTPAFAGFGLFNGAVGFAADRFFAALFDHVPPLSPAPRHLMAFSAVDGSTAWDDEIGTSWSSVGIGGGLVFTGAFSADEVYAYDAATGARLATLPLPGPAIGGPSIVGGTIYVPYGLGGSAGVRAFGLPD